MPDPTDFVTDLPADFEIFGDAVDATVDGIDNRVTDLEVITTEGDLIVGDATGDPVALPIGAVGTVLTSDGDTAEWAAPVAPASGADWTLLNAGGTSLSGSTTTISGISGKDKIMMLVNGASTDTTSSQIRVLVNGLSTGIYTHFWSQNSGPSTYAATNQTGNDGVATTRILLAFLSNNEASVYKGGITFTGCNSSGVKQFEYNGSGSASGGTGHTSQSGQGIVDTSATITSISLVTATGTFDAGTIFVYASA
jgi:hypothetical protein